MMSSVRGWSCGKPSACNNILEHCYGKTSIVVFFNEGLNITCFLALFNFLRKTALCILLTCTLSIILLLLYFDANKFSLRCFCEEHIGQVSKSEEQFPKDTVGCLSAICRPSVGQLLADCWPTVACLSLLIFVTSLYAFYYHFFIIRSWCI